MDDINIQNFISIVESHECIWKNSSVNAANLREIELAWRSVAFQIYDNFDDLKENQTKFWVNNLKRKWKIIFKKFNTLGPNYEYWTILQFLPKTRNTTENIVTSEIIQNSSIKKIPAQNDDISVVNSNILNKNIVKCGEIFYDLKGYYYQCTICDSNFNLREIFEDHLTILHGLPKKNQNSENIEYLIEEEPTVEDFNRELIKDSRESENKDNISNGLEKNIIVENKIIHGDGNAEENEIFYENRTVINKEFKNNNEECPHCFLLFPEGDHDTDRCFKIQEKISQLNGDLRALRDENIFHCDRCPKYFDFANEMYEHRRNEHYEICPVCKIRLLYVENHVISHHADLDYDKLKIPDSFILGIFKCKFCERQYDCKSDWIMHKKRCEAENNNGKKAIRLY